MAQVKAPKETFRSLLALVAVLVEKSLSTGQSGDFICSEPDGSWGYALLMSFLTFLTDRSPKLELPSHIPPHGASHTFLSVISGSSQS